MGLANPTISQIPSLVDCCAKSSKASVSLNSDSSWETHTTQWMCLTGCLLDRVFQRLDLGMGQKD